MRFMKLVSRALRLRCPICGQGSLFAGLLKMHANCPHCGVKFEREPGFFVGSIYINYGLTALIATVIYISNFVASGFQSTRNMQVGLVVFALVFPLLFFRHARSLWLGFDQWHDPRPDETP